MNATTSLLAQRRASSEQLRAIVENFRAAEPAIIAAGTESFGKLIASALPRFQAYALETGEFVGRMNVECTIDLSEPHKKTMRLVAVSVPPPWKIEQFADVRI